jgi:uncharacterized protein (TIGR02271 family)
MISTSNVNDIIGADVVDPENDKVGKVGQVYLDSDTNEPTWVSVKTGLFGMSETLVPVDDATWADGVLRVNVDKQQVKDAPRVEADQELSPEEQDRLYEFYHRGASGGGYGSTTGDFTETGSGATYSDSTSGGTLGSTDAGYSDTTTGGGIGGAATGGAATGGATYSEATGRSDIDTGSNRNEFEGGTDRTDFDGDVNRQADRGYGNDVSGPETDDAMTRSEERLNVGKERVQTGKARLRKYVVQEQQNVTVPVEREEVRLEREPITDANVGAATSGKNLSDEEHEVTLSEERVSVNKETVPVERVRLGTEKVTENENVSETVGKEQIDFEGDGDATRGRGV